MSMTLTHVQHASGLITQLEKLNSLHSWLYMQPHIRKTHGLLTDYNQHAGTDRQLLACEHNASYKNTADAI
jgi:hypothetical protein